MSSDKKAILMMGSGNKLNLYNGSQCLLPVISMSLEENGAKTLTTFLI